MRYCSVLKYKNHHSINHFKSLFMRCLLMQHSSVFLCNHFLVSREIIITSRREGASLPLAGHPSSDGIKIKIPYVVDFLFHRLILHPTFPIGFIETESQLIKIVEIWEMNADCSCH